MEGVAHIIKYKLRKTYGTKSQKKAFKQYEIRIFKVYNIKLNSICFVTPIYSLLLNKLN